MKKNIYIPIILCIIIFAGVAGYSYIMESLTFSDDDYTVYVPIGAPEDVWTEKDLYYVTAQMSFEYANELLFEDDYEHFTIMFFECYDKFSGSDDIYYAIKNVFISPEKSYSKKQEEVLLGCVEELYQKELLKEDNKFLTEKNLMLQVELNREFGNYIKAFKLKDKMEQVRKGEVS